MAAAGGDKTAKGQHNNGGAQVVDSLVIPPMSVAELFRMLNLNRVSDTLGDLDGLWTLLKNKTQDRDLPAPQLDVLTTCTTLDMPYGDIQMKCQVALQHAVSVTGSQDRELAIAMYHRLMDDLVAKADHATLLMAQVVARAHPMVVRAAAERAATMHKHNGHPAVAIACMWMLAQARTTDTAATVDAWEKYVMPALVDDKADDTVRQNAARYTEMLTKLKTAESAGRIVKMDIIGLWRTAYAAAARNGDKYVSVLLDSLDYFTDVWACLARKTQVEDVFHSIVVQCGGTGADAAQPADTVYTTLAARLLARHNWLFTTWGQWPETLSTQGNNAYAAFLIGSQHLLAGIRGSRAGRQLPRRALHSLALQLVATVQQAGQKPGQPEKAEDRARQEDVLKFFKKFEEATRPSRLPALIGSALLLFLLTMLVVKTNANCVAHPCGPSRPCEGTFHPCKVLRHSYVAGAVDQVEEVWTKGAGYTEQAAAWGRVQVGQPAWQVAEWGLRHIGAGWTMVTCTAGYAKANVLQPVASLVTTAHATAERLVITVLSTVEAYTPPPLLKFWRMTKAVDLVFDLVVEHMAMIEQWAIKVWFWAEANVVVPGLSYADGIWQDVTGQSFEASVIARLPMLGTLEGEIRPFIRRARVFLEGRLAANQTVDAFETTNGDKAAANENMAPNDINMAANNKVGANDVKVTANDKVAAKVVKVTANDKVAANGDNTVAKDEL